MTIASRAMFPLGALFAMTAVCPAAFADSARIALVRPQVSSPAITEALTRIQGELTADGFEVILVDSPGGTDPATTAGPDIIRAVATLGVFVDAGAHAAELRVMDRLTNKIVVRRTAIEAAETPRLAEVLAVRAVELLRASLLELLIESRPPPEAGAPQPPPTETRQASQWAAHALRQERQSTWAVEAGTGMILGFGGIGPALLGVVRVFKALAAPLGARVTIAGLGTQPRVDAPAGAPRGVSATVSQQIGLVELVGGPWPDALVHPIVSLGAGALNATVAGQGSGAAYVGLTSSGWSFVADAGAGAQLRLGSRFDVSLEAHAFVAQPYPVARFLDADVPIGGRPSLLGSLTVVGWL